jgi:hypothetical protein
LHLRVSQRKGDTVLNSIAILEWSIDTAGVFLTGERLEMKSSSTFRYTAVNEVYRSKRQVDFAAELLGRQSLRVKVAPSPNCEIRVGSLTEEDTENPYTENTAECITRAKLVPNPVQLTCIDTRSILDFAS